jgi:predicted dehydrogenase
MKLLVAGLGSIGARHAQNAAAVSDVETAVLDLAPGVAERVGRELGVRHFVGWEEALAWGPRAAVVAVPTHLHLEAAGQLVRRGADVLVEKPVSDRLAGVKEFLDEAESLGRKVYVVCNMRFHPALRAVREALPAIGKPLFARAHYGNYLPDMRPGADYRELYCARRQTGGGVILDAIHEVDYLSWFFGRAVSVSCESARLSDLDIDVEDYAGIHMRHESGVRSETHLDYLRRHKRRGLEVVGENGSVIWLSEGKKPESCTVRRHVAGRGWETVFHDDALDASPMYAELMRRFVEAVRGGGDQELLTGNQAGRELAAVLAAHRSGEEGRTVSIREFEG